MDKHIASNDPAAAAMDQPLPAADAKTQALARLAASRQRLALQLLPPPSPTLYGPGAQAGPMADRMEAWWRHWRARAHRSPLASMALAAARQWWRAQPWRGTAELLGREWRAAAVPLVRRHPIASVGLAAAVAAGLVVWRPWRSRQVASHTQALGRRARGWLMAQARQLPWQTLMAGLVALWAGQRAAEQAQTQAQTENDTDTETQADGQPQARPEAVHTPQPHASTETPLRAPGAGRPAYQEAA